MNIEREIHAPGAWSIDLKKKVASHKSGLIVFLTEDSGRCEARHSNAEIWVRDDFRTRAPLVPGLLKAAVKAYEAAQGRKK